MSLLVFVYSLLNPTVNQDHIYKCIGKVCSNIQGVSVINRPPPRKQPHRSSVQEAYLNLDLLLFCLYMMPKVVSSPLCFLSGDECEFIGGRQGGVRRCGPRGEHHAGQRVHSDEGVGSAKPQQSDLYPPPQPEASGGICPAQIPR